MLPFLFFFFLSCFRPFTHSGFRASSAITMSHGFMVTMCCRALGVQLTMGPRQPSASDLVKVCGKPLCWVTVAFWTPQQRGRNNGQCLGLASSRLPRSFAFRSISCPATCERGSQCAVGAPHGRQGSSIMPAMWTHIEFVLASFVKQSART